MIPTIFEHLLLASPMIISVAGITIILIKFRKRDRKKTLSSENSDVLAKIAKLYGFTYGEVKTIVKVGTQLIDNRMKLWE